MVDPADSLEKLLASAKAATPSGKPQRSYAVEGEAGSDQLCYSHGHVGGDVETLVLSQGLLFN